MQVQRILVPIDFSQDSPMALAEAAEIARGQDARLTLLHVHPIETMVFMDFTYIEPAETVAEVCAAAEKTLHDMLKKVPPPTPLADVEVVTGSPVDEIVNRSKDHDLIVMPTHGRSGVRHFLLGSVAERVVKAASCSVLIVKNRPRTA